VSWEAYCGLADSLGERNHARLSYDGKTLEIVSPGSLHEFIANLIADMLAMLRIEWSGEWQRWLRDNVNRRETS
jgi:hypothetical protein